MGAGWGVASLAAGGGAGVAFCDLRPCGRRRGGGCRPGAEVAPSGLRHQIWTGAIPPCGAPPISLASDSLRWCGEVGRRWALNRGKPLADGGGHEVDDAGDGAVLLLEGDIEVVSPPSPALLISGESPKLRFGRRRRSGVVPSLEALVGDSGYGWTSSAAVGRQCLCLLLAAWSSVLWCGLRVAVMFVGGGAARRVLEVLLPGSDLRYPCVLRESSLPLTGPAPLDPGRESRELSAEVETDGAWVCAWPLEVD